MGIDVKPGFTTEAPEEEHDEGGDCPCVALVDMYHVISDKARDEAAHANDDDADDERKGAGIDVSQCLASEDDGYNRKSESRRGQ